MTRVNSNTVTASDIDAQTPPPNDDRPLNIEDVRREIDSVDQALLGLIAKRLELAAAVRKAKSGIIAALCGRSRLKPDGDFPPSLVFTSLIFATRLSVPLARDHLYISRCMTADFWP